MKRKILCTVTALILLSAFCMNVSAFGPYNDVPKSEWTETHLIIDDYLIKNYGYSAYAFFEYKDKVDGYTVCYGASSSNPAELYTCIGEYYLFYEWPGSAEIPIYLLKGDEVYTLQEAYDKKLCDFKELLLVLRSNAGIIGDANKDWEIDIKDVTVIQRYIADHIVAWNGPCMDYNRDERINIKDATAIQMFLAEK